MDRYRPERYITTTLRQVEPSAHPTLGIQVSLYHIPISASGRRVKISLQRCQTAR